MTPLPLAQLLGLDSKVDACPELQDDQDDQDPLLESEEQQESQLDTPSGMAPPGKTALQQAEHAVNWNLLPVFLTLVIVSFIDRANLVRGCKLHPNKRTVRKLFRLLLELFSVCLSTFR